MASVNTQHGKPPEENSLARFFVQTLVRFGYELLEISFEVVDSIGR